MNVNHLSSNVASHFASRGPLDHLSVGAEHRSSDNTVIQPVDQSPSVAKVENSLPSPNDNFDTSSNSSVSEEESTEKDAGAEEKKEQAELKLEQEEIRELSTRDREVRAHEQAHMAVGGQFAGAAQYQFERGPDGVSYAVGGEVPIDVGKAPSPEATIQKAQVVRRAALAPAEPSPQDRRVASMASQMEAQARQDLNSESVEESENQKETQEAGKDEQAQGSSKTLNKAEEVESAPNYGASSNFSSSAPPSFINSRLERSIANANLHSHSPGQLLDQIA